MPIHPLIKEKQFKVLRKSLLELNISNKVIRCLFDPFKDANADNYFKYLNGDIGYHSLVRYSNIFNKTQAELYKSDFDYIEEKKLQNWTTNIFKYDLLIPVSVFEYLENKFSEVKNSDDVVLDTFITNNRNNIYCIFHKILKYWFSITNKGNIEREKLYNKKFSLSKHFIGISKNEFYKYSKHYAYILSLLESWGIIFCDDNSRPTYFLDEEVIIGKCKGFRISEKFIDLYDEKDNDYTIVRISSKVCVRELYYDNMAFKENMKILNEDKKLESNIVDEETYHYFLEDYEKKPKKINVTKDCRKLINRYNDNLIVENIYDVYSHVEENEKEISQKGLERGKTNIVDRIFDYLSFFDLRYKRTNISKFNNFNYFLDRTGRFYSFFNHCPKELINIMFKLKNKKGIVEEIEEVDMRACHINMLALLFNKEILNNYSIQSFIGPQLLEWFNKKMQKIAPDQIESFKNLCSSPDYYDKIKNLVEERTGKTYTVNEIKQLNMFFLYSDHFDNPVKNVFKFYFPFIIDFFQEVKSHYNSLSKLSYLLMRMESYFFINKALPQILNHGITVLPKHDCFYVAKSDKEKVKNILTGIYVELTRGNIEYIPSFEKNDYNQNVLNIVSVDKKLQTRNTKLYQYLYKTRKAKVKQNIYVNLYYQYFNEFLIKNGIKNFKAKRDLNEDKFRKIIKRFIKDNKNDDTLIEKELGELIDVFNTKQYEIFMKSKLSESQITDISYVIADYMQEDINNKLIDKKIFLATSRFDVKRIKTPFEHYKLLFNKKDWRERHNTENYLIY